MEVTGRMLYKDFERKYIAEYNKFSFAYYRRCIHVVSLNIVFIKIYFNNWLVIKKICRLLFVNCVDECKLSIIFDRVNKLAVLILI